MPEIGTSPASISTRLASPARRPARNAKPFGHWAGVVSVLPGMEMMACQNLAVPAEVMQHVVNVESSRNPFAIGVVGGQLVRQPQNLGEAVATVNMLEQKRYNYSLGVAQVNRANLGKYGLNSYARAFELCPNLVAGSQILAQCYASAGGDWGKAFSCYYSGDF